MRTVTPDLGFIDNKKSGGVSLRLILLFRDVILERSEGFMGFLVGDFWEAEKRRKPRSLRPRIIPLVIVWHIGYTYYDMISNFILGLE